MPSWEPSPSRYPGRRTISRCFFSSWRILIRNEQLFSPMRLVLRLSGSLRHLDLSTFSYLSCWPFAYTAWCRRRPQRFFSSWASAPCAGKKRPRDHDDPRVCGLGRISSYPPVFAGRDSSLSRGRPGSCGECRKSFLPLYPPM